MGLPAINWPFGGSAGSSSRVPLTTRLHAWWEGYEIIPPEGDGLEEKLGELDYDGRFPAPESGEVWNEQRRKLVQLIWGDGFSVPDSYDYCCDLVGAFSLTSVVSMLEIGAGLGGGTRAIVDKFGTYVTALEANPELARAGLFISKTHSVEDKAGIQPFTLDTLEIKDNYYEGVLVHGALLPTGSKNDLLAKAVKALKPEGLIVITDLFIEKDSDLNQDEFKKWVEAEPGKAMPWKQDEVKKCFDTLNVLTRITTDQTAEYQSRALRGWDRFIQKFDGGKLTRELTIPLVQEVEVWARRMAAMDAGVLHFYRFVGVKQHG